MNDKSNRLLTVAACLFCLTLGVCVGYCWRQPTSEENKAALKAAMLEALAERFPIFGPRGDKIDLAEEARRRDADPIGTLEFELQTGQQEAAIERITSAAKDYHADGATKEALERLFMTVRQELSAAEDRGAGRRGR